MRMDNIELRDKAAKFESWLREIPKQELTQIVF